MKSCQIESGCCNIKWSCILVKLSIKRNDTSATDIEHMHLCPPMCAFDSEARIGAWFTCLSLLLHACNECLLQNFVNGPPFDGVCPLCHMFH